HEQDHAAGHGHHARPHRDLDALLLVDLELERAQSSFVPLLGEREAVIDQREHAGHDQRQGQDRLHPPPRDSRRYYHADPSSRVISDGTSRRHSPGARSPSASPPTSTRTSSSTSWPTAAAMRHT